MLSRGLDTEMSARARGTARRRVGSPYRSCVGGKGGVLSPGSWHLGVAPAQLTKPTETCSVFPRPLPLCPAPCCPPAATHQVPEGAQGHLGANFLAHGDERDAQHRYALRGHEC